MGGRGDGYTIEMEVSVGVMFTEDGSLSEVS
jgi:hypothetical protein